MTDAASMTYTPDIEIINKGFSKEKPEEIISAPKKSDPVSPINIFAGCRLKKRKPSDAPIIDDAISDTSVLNAAEIYIRDTPIPKATEEARPSIPSVKLAAFTMPTSKINARGSYSGPRSTSPNEKDTIPLSLRKNFLPKRKNRATMICNESF